MPENWTPTDDDEDEQLTEYAALLIPETQYDLDPGYHGVRTRAMKAIGQ